MGRLGSWMGERAQGQAWSPPRLRRPGKCRYRLGPRMVRKPSDV